MRVHSISGGTILSQVIEKYAAVVHLIQISPC